MYDHTFHVTLDTGLEVGIGRDLRESGYLREEVHRFGFPLSDRSALEIETGSAGYNLCQVRVVDNEGKTLKPILKLEEIPYDGRKLFFTDAVAESFQNWNKISQRLGEITGVRFQRTESLTDLLTNSNVLLRKVKDCIGNEKLTKSDIWNDKSKIKIGHNPRFNWLVCYSLFFDEHDTRAILGNLPENEFTNYHKLDSIYSNTNLYPSPPDAYIPPAERRPHVLVLELTSGCDYNRCLFCDAPKQNRFSEKSLAEFCHHVDGVAKEMGDFKERIKRVFIGRNNALAVDNKKLLGTIKYITKRLGYWRAEHIHERDRVYIPGQFIDFNGRIAIYGRTDTIRAGRAFKLRELRSAGLGMVYWGVESGSDEVLEYVHKGTTLQNQLDAGYVAKTAGMHLSTMIMMGLGGMRFYDSHVEGTAQFINEIQPEYVTFLGTNPAHARRYDIKVRGDKGNRHLTQEELARQTMEIIERVVPYHGKFGMFDDSVDKLGISPVCFNATFTQEGKQQILSALRNYLGTIKS